MLLYNLRPVNNLYREQLCVLIEYLIKNRSYFKTLFQAYCSVINAQHVLQDKNDIEICYTTKYFPTRSKKSPALPGNEHVSRMNRHNLLLSCEDQTNIT